MCYTLYISTDSNKDLQSNNSALVQFKRIDASEEDVMTAMLNLENKWFVGSATNCSCTFRHLYSTGLGFGEPQDWYPEETDEVEATKKLYKVISDLLDDGSKVECLDVWTGAKPADISILEVQLDTVSEKEFRLFENHLLRFTQLKRQSANT